VANIFTSNGGGFSDVKTALTFKNNIFFLAVAILACAPVIPMLKKLCDKTYVTRRAWSVASAVAPVLLIAISALALAGDSYNPFLYFQF
jgi:alginate O-acetyltransferase complex protein AlgI